jgi:hypothetical protein
VTGNRVIREINVSVNELWRRANRFVSEPLRWRQISAVAARLDQLPELDRRQVGQIKDQIAAAGDSQGFSDGKDH